MYNRYISARQRQTVTEKQGRPDRERYAQPDQEKYTQAWGQPQGEGKNFSSNNIQKLWELFGRDKLGVGSGLLRGLGLNDLDTGDILLFLIILFLLSEGDELDLLITLGIALLMSMGGEKKNRHPED